MFYRQHNLSKFVLIPMTGTGSILLFDDECNLCHRLVKFIIRNDKRASIKFSPLQSDIGKSLLKRYGLPDDELKSVVYFKGNKYFLRSSAVLNIFKELRGGWKFFYGLIIIPEFMRDFFYNIIAKARYRIFGKKISSQLPEAIPESRILK